MSYFSDGYLTEQLHRLYDHWESRLVGRAGFLQRGSPLYILNVDVKRSTQLPAELRESIVQHVRLILATDVISRDGVVIRLTDGLDAFFTDAAQALRAGVSIYHRKRQLQERVFQPIIVQHYRGQPAEVKVGHRDIDYRVCLVQCPQNQADDIIQRHRNDAKRAAQSLAELWFEAVSRYNNDQSFLISKRMYESVRASNPDGLVRFFDTNAAVPLVEAKTAAPRIGAFFADGFYSYNNPDYRNVDVEAVLARPSDSAELMEANFRLAYETRRDQYQRRKGYEGVARTDDLLFDYFKLEQRSDIRSRPAAVVLGDLNLDFVTYLADDEAAELAASRGHMQLQQDIEKVVAGKGFSMATVLEGPGRFDPVVLIGKLGMDREMAYVVQELRAHAAIRPILFLSESLPTGTSVSLRRKTGNASLVTITDKPNANSDLRLEEVQPHWDTILGADYFFVSGYCLLDGRIQIIQALLDKISAQSGKHVVLEFSPKHLLWRWFSQSEERKRGLQEILKRVSILVYEEGAFGDEATEQRLLREVPVKLRIGEAIDTVQEQRYAKGWSRIRNLPSYATGSLGLFSRRMADYVTEEFLKPQILLCSQSPRRYELLTALYGHASVHHLREISSPEFRTTTFGGTEDVLAELVRVTTTKLSGALQALGDQDRKELQSCKVALASDLVVVSAPKRGKHIVLDKPDDTRDPVGQAKKYLLTHLSGRAHDVWTCTCFLQFRDFFHGDLEWDRDRLARCAQALRKLSRRPLPRKALQQATGEDELAGKAGTSCEWREHLKLDGNKKLDVRFLLSLSRVTFRELSDSEIEEYLACGEWRTKAGGYAIQGSGGYFVEEVLGSFTNVIGLPMPDLSRVLSKFFGITPAGQR